MAQESVCCPPGSLPELVANHKDAGVEVDLPGSDMKLYVVGSGDKVVIHFYDIFGFNGGRTRFVCDQMSKQGYKVVVPDIYRGDSCIGKPMTPDALIPFVKQFTCEKVVADTEAVMKYLKEQGATKFAATGTCWGAWAFYHCCAQGLEFSAGVGWHPSLNLEEMFGREVLDLVKKVKVPQLLLPAGNDPDYVKPGGAAVKALEENGVEVEVKDYPKAIHGYMARADMADPEAVNDVEDATARAYKFLEKYLK